MSTRASSRSSAPQARRGRVERPPASSGAAQARMRSTPRRDTSGEMRVRRLLHASGLRYTVDARPLDCSPRRADVVFRRARVAVFVDGCFWHGCPRHGSWPKANSQFWREKILANKERDLDTTVRLRERGWLVIRIWEHDDPVSAASRIARRVRQRTASLLTTSRSRL